MEITVPYKGQEPYIFISYAHRNIGQVYPIIAQMQQDGYRIWYDDGINPGSEWDDNIAEHIQKCSYFIAFLSEEYLYSDNCRDELNYARSLGKNRLLVYLTDVTLPAGMDMRLNRLQAVYWQRFRTPEDALDKIYEAEGLEICRDEGKEIGLKEPAVSPEPVPPVRKPKREKQRKEKIHKPNKKKKKLPLVIIGAVVVLIVLTVAILQERDSSNPGGQPEETVGIDPSALPQEAYLDGTYLGTGKGFGGEILVQVTVSEGRIAEIQIVQAEDELPASLEQAEQVIPAVLVGQSTQVDAVSGATASSRGILEGIENALAQAIPSEETPVSTETGDGNLDAADMSCLLYGSYTLSQMALEEFAARASYVTRETGDGAYEMSERPVYIAVNPAYPAMIELGFCDKFSELYFFYGTYTLVDGLLKVEPCTEVPEGFLAEFPEAKALREPLEYTFTLLNGEYKLLTDSGYVCLANEHTVETGEIVLNGQAASQEEACENILYLNFVYANGVASVCEVGLTDGGHSTDAYVDSIWENIASIVIRWTAELRPYNGREETFDVNGYLHICFYSTYPYGFVFQAGDEIYVYQNEIG